MSYTFRKVNVSSYYPLSCSNQYGQSGASTCATVYSQPDSSIFYYHTHPLGCDTGLFCYFDSSYVDTSSYHSRKINRHSEGINDSYSYDTAFVDGLGQIKGMLGVESGTQAQGGFDLIYYHLVSGEVWGSPYYFSLPDGIHTLSSDMGASVNPDPVTEVFRVSVGDVSALPASFTICDATGRIVLRQTLTSATTNMSRDGIADGLYIWSLSANAGGRINFGKMVVK